MKQNKKSIIILFLILAVAVVIRGAALNHSPPQLNWDEAALGYNAYSLLQTGKDEYGRVWPLTLRSFDDYKGAIYSYADMIFIKTLGLTERAVRLPSVLAGVGLVGLAYLIARKLFDEKAGLWAAGVIAISPWAVIFSRTAFEANLALFFLVSGAYLSFLKESRIARFGGVFLLMLSAYTYHAEKLIVPFVLLALLIKLWVEGKKKLAKQLFIWALVLGAPLVKIILWGEGASRLQHTNILKLWGVMPETAPQSFLVVPFYFAGELIGRALSLWSPATLFVRGSNTPGQQLYQAGIFPLTMFLAWWWGVYQWVKEKRKTLGMVLLGLSVLGVISWNWLSVVRSLPLLWLQGVMIGYGVSRLWDKLGAWRWILAGAMLLETVWVTNSAWMSVPTYYAGDYQGGLKQVVRLVDEYDENYEKIIIDSPQAQVYIFTLFYLKYPPSQYQQEIKQLSAKELKEHERFGKFIFRRADWREDVKSEDLLLVTSKINVANEKIEKAEQAKLIDQTFLSSKEEQYRLINIKN